MAENDKIITKRPPYKESIGAQYYSFNNPEEGIDFDPLKYDEKTVKTETVKSVEVTESSESTPVYASGKVYETRSQLAYVDIAVESIAQDAEDLAKMRGDVIQENGLIQGKTTGKRPYFAYGKVVQLSGGNFRYDWYPKCQLVENSDSASTREEQFNEQNDNLTIRAYPFDEKGEIVKNSVDSSIKNFPKGLTEEQFFTKPIITSDDLDNAVSPGI